MQTTYHTPTAHAYARSLLELATEAGQAEVVGQELGAIAEALASDSASTVFLSSPSIKPSQRVAPLQRILAGKVSELTLNTIGLLNQRGKLSDLPGLISSYQEQLDKQLGNVDVDVIVAQPLTDEQTEQVRQSVSKTLGKSARINVKVDDSILGGLVVKIGDKLMDGSVRAQLDAMRDQLLAKRPA